MPLVDLKTDLKSLKFGNDRIGGGSSGQPYITSPIPEGTSTLGILNNDFLLRGGITAVSNTETDVLRLGKMFASEKSPSGILFIAKQQLLSRTAVRNQTSGILNEGIYTPLSTLAQAGVNAFGGHLNKQGINPFALTGPTSNNENLYDVKMKVNQNDLPASIDNNRLIQLKRNIVGLPGAKKKVDGFNFKSGRTGIFNDDPIMMSYGGGPGSELGIGRTNIYFASSGRFKTLSSPLSVNAETGFLSKSSPGTHPSTLSISQLNDAIEEEIIQTGYNGGIKQDFRAKLRGNLSKSKIISYAPSYLPKEGKTIDGPEGSRINYANPAGKTRNLISYTNGSGIGPVDKINALPIYKSKESQPNSAEYPTDDLVNFRIGVINNQNPEFKTYMHFRAYLGSISDSYNAGWNSIKYLGRGENFYTYQGFDRSISLSWTVAAQSKDELIPMYKKLNYLASSLAPDYGNNGYMKGNLVQLTIGGYLYEQPGFIRSMTLSIADDTPYEIGIDNKGNNAGDDSVKQLPHIIRVDGFEFIPIHNFTPALQQNTYGLEPSKNEKDIGTESLPESEGTATKYGNERFISLENKNGNNYDTNFKPPSDDRIAASNEGNSPNSDIDAIINNIEQNNPDRFL